MEVELEPMLRSKIYMPARSVESHFFVGSTGALDQVSFSETDGQK